MKLKTIKNFKEKNKSNSINLESINGGKSSTYYTVGESTNGGTDCADWIYEDNGTKTQFYTLHLDDSLFE
ncbi:MAG TPA: hypothetical protein VL022_10375 [Moheibacter sp.]|nr:hypothetical protein [Moheibacter sp.]